MLKKKLLYGIFILGTIGLIGCTNDETIDSQVDSSEEVSDWEPQYTTEVNEDIVSNHDEIHDEIMTTYENEEYSFDQPFVLQDPYDRAPLSALVMFETEEPSEITVTVEGETPETTLTHTYEGVNTDHEISVLGLYPETENQVTLTAETEEGETTENTLTIATDTIPQDMLDFIVVEANPEQMAEGLTFVSPSRAYPAGVDSNGDVRWYTSVKSSNQFKRLENGNVLMATLEEGQEEHDHLTEMTMLGRVVQSIEIDMESVIASSPLHHDTIILPNDNYLALLHDGSEKYVEDELAELDRETGEVVQRLNFKDIFPSEMYEDYEGHGEDVGDWIHINAVWKVEGEDSLLFSLRQQDAVMKMSYPEGEIDWIFGYPGDWPAEIEDYVLESNDENIKYPTGAHAMMEMPDQDGNDDTLDIMLFDNNRIITRGDEAHDEEYSRAVQYRINESENTVEEIWSYGEERGTDFYSSIVGDADYLPENESVLLTSGRVLNEDENQRYSKIVEVSHAEDSEVLYELHYGPFAEDEYLQIYRSERMPLHH